MKKKLVNILAATLLMGAMSAQAIPLVFTTTLSGVNENPPNGSPGTGSATVTVDDVLHTMRVQTTFTGLLGTTTATHIHCCTSPPGNAAVATPIPSFPDFPTGVTSGSYDQIFNMDDPASYNASFVTSAGSVPLAFNTLLNAFNTGSAYLNIHTSSFGSGEIRGFLAPAPAGVPSPGTLLLMLIGLGGLAWGNRFGATAIR